MYHSRIAKPKGVRVIQVGREVAGRAGNIARPGDAPMDPEVMRTVFREELSAALVRERGASEGLATSFLSKHGVRFLTRVLWFGFDCDPPVVVDVVLVVVVVVVVCLLVVPHSPN